MSIFQFKRFAIRHASSAMKVGTDAVLLGAWAFRNLRMDKGCGLDVGSGCGVITLMMAQRFPQLHWEGIDLNLNAAKETRDNALRSPFADNITVSHGDFLLKAFDHPIDLIICNPPYYQDALESNDEDRNMARQERFLMPDLFLEKAYRIGSDDCHLAVVLPLDRKEYWKKSAERVGWQLSRECAVKGNQDAKANRFLLEWTKTSKGSVLHSELTLEASRGARTKEYQALTADFYL